MITRAQFDEAMRKSRDGEIKDAYTWLAEQHGVDRQTVKQQCYMYAYGVQESIGDWLKRTASS